MDDRPRYTSLVLLSGGPDSATLLHHVARDKKQRVLALHMSTGLPPNREELRAAKAITTDLKIPLEVLDISNFVALGGGKMPTIHSEAHVLHFGTAAVLSMSSALAIEKGASSVWIALHREDAEESVEYGGKFIEFMNSGLHLIRAVCKVRAPFLAWPKSRILKHAASLGVPLAKTWSCLAPVRSKQCGFCGGCRARIEGFKNAKITDPTKYQF